MAVRGFERDWLWTRDSFSITPIIIALGMVQNGLIESRDLS